MAKDTETKSVTLRFAKELDNDGKHKITSGGKRRYKEVLNMDVGLGICIGTLYLSEAIGVRFGDPEEFKVTVGV